MADANTAAIGSTGVASSGVNTSYNLDTTNKNDEDNKKVAFMNSIWQTKDSAASAFLG